jgi:hypothetical protein
MKSVAKQHQDFSREKRPQRGTPTPLAPSAVPHLIRIFEMNFVRAECFELIS